MGNLGSEQHVRLEVTWMLTSVGLELESYQRLPSKGQSCSVSCGAGGVFGEKEAGRNLPFGGLYGMAGAHAEERIP